MDTGARAHHDRIGRGLPPLLLALVAFLGLAACSSIRFGELDPPEGRLIVVDVTFEGNDHVPSAAIAEVIATFADNTRLSGQKPLLDRSKLPVDARRIESFLIANGYFRARVTDYRVTEFEDGTARVHFVLVEGPATRTSSVELVGLDPAAADDPEARARLERLAERLPDAVPLEVGEVWREVDYVEGRKAIRTLLRDQGFLFVTVIGDVFVDERVQAARVRYRIVPGPLARVGSLVVEGNAAITAERILRRVDLVPGDIVETKRLRVIERRIYGLGVFFGVRAAARKPTLSEKLAGQPATYEAVRALVWDPVVPVVVTVQEMPIHGVTAGLGASIENDRSLVSARVGYENRNLFGGLRYFNAEVRPAAVFLPSFFVRDPTVAPGGTAEVLLRQPSLFEEYITGEVRTGYTLGVEVGYRSHKVDAALAVARPFFDVLTAIVSYNITFYQYFDVVSTLDLPAAETLGLSFR